MITYEFALSITAVILSLASFAFTIFANRHQRTQAAIAASNSGLVSVEARIAEQATLLRFHGFEDPEGELNDCGLSASEFAYLVNSFTLGSSYFRTSASPTTSLTEGSYRQQMCAAIPTRRAWPLIKRMLSDTPYRDHLENIFQKLERDQPLQLDRTNNNDANQEATRGEAKEE